MKMQKLNLKANWILILWIAIIPLFIISNSAHCAIEGSWERIGPEGGNFINAAINPEDNNQVTVFTSNPVSVFRTMDGGNTWEKISELPDTYLDDVYVHDYNTIYALSYSSVYKSTDGGATWTTNSFPYQEGYPGKVLCHPDDPNTVYVAGYYYDWDNPAGQSMNFVFFKSTNGGRRFTSSKHFTFDYCYPEGFAIAPSNPDVMYIAGYKSDDNEYGGILFQTKDGGEQWTDISGKLQPQNYESFNCVLTDPLDENKIYVMGSYCYRSNNGGETWVKGTKSMNAYTLQIDPADPNHLFAGGYDQYYYSTDAGRRWSTYMRRTPSIKGSCRNFTFSPSDPSLLYLGTANALYKSGDGGNTWNITHHGIYNSIVPALSVSPSHPQTFYINQQNFGVLNSKDGGNSWNESSNFTGNTSLSDLLVHSNDPQKILTLEDYGGRISQSSDAGQSWQEADSQLDRGHCLARDFNHPDTILAGGIKTNEENEDRLAISISKNGGTTWELLKILPLQSSDSMYNARVNCIFMTKENSKVIFTGGSDGENPFILRSDNGGKDWKSMTKNLMELHGFNTYNVSVDMILCDPGNEYTVFAGTNYNLFISTNGGSSWETTLLKRPVKKMAYDPVHELYYAATEENGVYYSENGKRWGSIGTKMRQIQCLSLGIDPANGTVYAGTNGYGIWRFTHTTGIPGWSLY